MMTQDFTINEYTPTPSSTQQTPGAFLFPFSNFLVYFFGEFSPQKIEKLNQIYST
jgi:hypothetical protein